MRTTFPVLVVVLGSFISVAASCSSSGSSSGGEAGDTSEGGSGAQSGAGANDGGGSAGEGTGNAGAGGAPIGGSSGEGAAAGAAGDGGGATTHTLSVSVEGIGAGTVTFPGGTTCGPLNETCTASFAAGASVTLTAEADGDDNGFVAWSGACSGSRATCTLTVDADLDVGAEFTRMFDVSVSFAEGPNCGTSTPAEVAVSTNVPGLSAMNCHSCRGAICHARFPAGTQLSITATPGETPSSCAEPSGVATLDNPAMTGACTANTTGGGFSTSPASCFFTVNSNASFTVYSCQQSG